MVQGKFKMNDVFYHENDTLTIELKLPMRIYLLIGALNPVHIKQSARKKNQQTIKMHKITHSVYIFEKKIFYYIAFYV